MKYQKRISRGWRKEVICRGFVFGMDKNGIDSNEWHGKVAFAGESEHLSCFFERLPSLFESDLIFALEYWTLGSFFER